MKVIVIGATSGIGLEVARLFAKRGYTVGIAGRRLDKLKEITGQTTGIVAYRQIDVTDDDARTWRNGYLFPQFRYWLAE